MVLNTLVEQEITNVDDLLSCSKDELIEFGIKKFLAERILKGSENLSKIKCENSVVSEEEVTQPQSNLVMIQEVEEEKGCSEIPKAFLIFETYIDTGSESHMPKIRLNEEAFKSLLSETQHYSNLRMIGVYGH